MPDVSIIVTTYNIEAYVEECLESVAAQTLRRTGRVTVRVTVTYRPNQGIATSVAKRVTLLRRR